MQKSLLLFFIFFIASNLYAQNLHKSTFTITGKVADKATNEAIAYATVVLTKPTDSKAIAKTTVTDAKGYFMLNTPKDSYSLQVHYLGYSGYKKTLTPDCPIQ